MEEQYFYVIGVGNSDDWEAGRGSVYYMENKQGEKAVPVFTTSEKAERYINAGFNAPEIPAEVLESVPEPYVQALTEGRFVVTLFDSESVVRWASSVNAHYLMRDPRPGPRQEILRLDR